MQVSREGSVRVDLVGGTLDLEPINLILPNVVTLNVATGLKAKVVIEQSEFGGVEIHSLDYRKQFFFHEKDFASESLYGDGEVFGKMKFVAQILDIFSARKHLKLTLSSGAPAGSGLGGSSAMGVTLYRALCDYFDRPYEINQAVRRVRSTEGRILNQGIPGYQDYFPALAGGILAVKGGLDGPYFEQLYQEDLARFLEGHMTLVYSGIQRNSGINNWDVYKGFFDGNMSIRRSLAEIARVSDSCYQAFKNGKFQEALELIAQEGEFRKSLAPGIVSSEILELHQQICQKFSHVGLKMCGAGGGGCFILTHSSSKTHEIREFVRANAMEVLDFNVQAPVQ